MDKKINGLWYSALLYWAMEKIPLSPWHRICNLLSIVQGTAARRAPSAPVQRVSHRRDPADPPIHLSTGGHHGYADPTDFSALDQVFSTHEYLKFEGLPDEWSAGA